jgi:phage tail protein X
MIVISDRLPVTNTAVAVRLPDTVADTLLLSECIDGVSLTHLENVLPVAVAFMKIVSPEATGIAVPDIIVYTAPFIITATEPVPSKFAESVKPPVTNTAVAVRLLSDAVVDTVLLSECRDPVLPTHLENVLPDPVAVSSIKSPEAMGMTVLAAVIA